MIVYNHSKTNQVSSILPNPLAGWDRCGSGVGLKWDLTGQMPIRVWPLDQMAPGSSTAASMLSVFLRWNRFFFFIFAYKYTTLNCDVTVVRQMCAYFYFVFLFSHAASHRTHRTHSVTHPLISWLSCITYCSLSVWKLTWTAATHHTWPGGSQCVCVFLCVPGALQSLASFSAWFSWWVLWRPCACACACAWRMGEGHVLACSAPPTSILWPRAIQVGLQKCGAREMEFTRKQNGRCQRWRLVQENKREKKKTSESDGIKMPVLGKRRMIIWKWSCMFWIIRI